MLPFHPLPLCKQGIPTSGERNLDPQTCIICLSTWYCQLSTPLLGREVWRMPITTGVGCVIVRKTVGGLSTGVCVGGGGGVVGRL